MKAKRTLVGTLISLLFLAAGSVLWTGCNSASDSPLVPSTDPYYKNYFELQNFVTVGAGSLIHPAGLVATGTKMWVADPGSNSLQLWNGAGTHSWIKTITTFNGGNTFNGLWGLALDPATNNLYVAGGANGNVVVFDINGNYLTTLTAGASNVRGIVIDPTGTTAYVTDSVTGGYIYTIGGTPTAPTFTFTTQFGTSGTGKLTTAYQLDLDPSGNVWVADYAGPNVKEYSSAGTYIKKITSSKFIHPTDIKIRPNADMVITDEGADNIYVYNSALKKTGTLGGNPGGPEGIEIMGDIYFVTVYAGGFVGYN